MCAAIQVDLSVVLLHCKSDGPSLRPPGEMLLLRVIRVRLGPRAGLGVLAPNEVLIHQSRVFCPDL